MTATVVLVLRIGLAVALYVFLWRVLQTVWQELKQQGSLLAAQKRPRLDIDAKTEDGREYKYHFQQTEIVIGRGSNCDISLTDDTLSSHHARISYHHTQWWLEDLGSTNGTFLNKVQISVPTVIISDDQFQCGNTIFGLRMEPILEQVSPKTQNQAGGPQ
jgi:predicted component of type VI protein secretion system